MKKVFICYSHRDRKWLERLRVHLNPLSSTEEIYCWSDQEIPAGATWREEIESAMHSSVAALLLISGDFLASDFITKVELPMIFEARRTRKLLVLQLHVKPSVFEAFTLLAGIKALNEPRKSVVDLDKPGRERLLAKVAIEVAKLIRPTAEPSPSSPHLTQAEAELVRAVVFHPAGTEYARGPLERCQLRINGAYEKPALWSKYADLWVSLVGIADPGNVFLIPSGFASRRLRDPWFLKENSGDLALKRQASRAFAAKFVNDELSGYRFVMRSSDGKDRIKVYSEEYDRFLNEWLAADR